VKTTSNIKFHRHDLNSLYTADNQSFKTEKVEGGNGQQLGVIQLMAGTLEGCLLQVSVKLRTIYIALIP